MPELPSKNSNGQAVGAARRSTPIAPTDTVDITNYEAVCPLGITASGGGNISGVLAGDTGADRVFLIIAGQHYSYFFRRISATGTTATGILGLS